ncbi:hypothetical protein MMC29_002915 [Sticta canariensis]|nr:hypothetical protein [Sticta canariensis]
MDIEIVPETSLCLFKEIRVGNEAGAGNVIQIEVPSTSVTASFSRNPRPRRRVQITRPTIKDEEDFGRRLLASSSSIYFGAAHTYPRSIVWRILEGAKVLELRSADLSKSDRETKEATCILQLFFPNAIRYGGVALTDGEDHASLSLFVLTQGAELYTFTIRRDFFCYVKASEEGINKWCKIFKPSSFSINTPYRLFAETSLHIVVSLSDGRLLHLTRGSGGDGSHWHETTYSDGQWGSSLRGLVRWQGSNVVKFDGTALDQETPAGIALSSDRKHAFVVCLNHTLKVWNLDVARNVFSTDLLGQKREPHEIPKVMLDPGMEHKVQIFQADTITDGDLYYVMTFSPHGLGQFKIWAVRDPDEGALGIRDMFPEVTLRPPDPDPSPESKSIWKVADFKVRSAGKGREMEMWILMRSNKYYRLYHLKFDMYNFAIFWRDDWSMTASETLDQHPQPHISDDGPEDIRDMWLSFFLQPGRYPETVLETALSMYTVARKLGSPAKPSSSLKERMCSVIASNIRLRKTNTGSMDFKNYQADINKEWILFGQDVRDLNTSRWDVLSMAYDENVDMPWVVFADGYSAVRDCSRIETLAHNTSLNLAKSLNLLESPSIEIEEDAEPKLADELAVLVEAASAFRKSFNYSLRQSCKAVLITELWQDPLHSVPARMQSFYDQCNFAEEIADSCIGDLEAGLGSIGGYSGLETELFLAIINDLPQMSADASNLSVSKFGLKVLVEGARQMIDLHERVLLDLLIMVIFVNAEIDTEENSMESLDASKVYVVLLELLKQYQMMQWLVNNVRAYKEEPETHAPSTTSTIERQKSDKRSSSKTSTVLENLFAVDPKPQAYSQQSQSTALTRSIQDVLKWVIGGNEPSITLDSVLVYVQCNLLANQNIELASDFLRYQPSTAWATYIKGRLSLVQGQFTEAAIYFKKAAFKLCKLFIILFFPADPTDFLSSSARPKSSFDFQSASHNLLSPLEAAHLGNGLTSYYTHVLTLFESSQCHSYTSSFAQLALQFSPATETDQTSPLLVSLFHASLSTHDFSTAFSALSRHPDPTTLLPSLIVSMLSNNETPKLLSFPFSPTLHSAVDTFLLQKAQSSVIEPNESSRIPKYYNILSTWRLRHNDFRGAAAALLERLQRVQKLGARSGQISDGGEGVIEGYLTVINLLACAGEGWVLSGGDDGADIGNGEKRRVVTIKDVRKGYQDELDRRSMIENGRFGFECTNDNNEDEMDVL